MNPPLAMQHTARAPHDHGYTAFGATGRWQVMPWAVAAAVVVLYAVLLWKHFAPAIVMPDDNGYFAQASRLVCTGGTSFVPESDAQYIGLHWLLTPDGRYVSRYPMGLSVLVAPLYAVFGWQAGVLVNPLLALAALAGTWVLTRKLVGGLVLPSVAALLLGFHPVFMHHALAGDAHMSVLAAVVWAMVLVLAWRQTRGEGRRAVALAAASGALLGLIPLLRYPDAVMWIGPGGLAVWTVLRWWQAGRRRAAAWSLAAMTAAALAVLLPQLVHNHLLLGAFWRTGYSLSNEQSGFGWAYFRSNWLLYLRTMQAEGPGLMLGLGLAGLAAMAAVRRARGFAWMGLGVAVPMLLLYMSYYWAGVGGAGGPGILRFLLPTFVVYIVAGVWLLGQATAAAPPWSRLAAGVVLVGGLLLWASADWQGTLPRLQQQRANLAAVTAEMQRAVPPGAVVIAESGLLQHLDYVRQWKLADPALYRGGPLTRAAALRDPDAPSPMQAAKVEQLRQLYPGTPEQRRDKFARDVRAWAGDAGVYVVGTEAELAALAAAGRRRAFEVVARVAVTPPPATPPGATLRGANARLPGPGAPPRDRPAGGGLLSAGTFGGAREVLIARWRQP